MPDHNEQDTTDPGAAPNASNAGSVGHPIGTGMAGAGTGTSIGSSRGNIGPGTGSDALEAQLVGEPATRLSEMLGVGDERPGADQGGNSPLVGNRRLADAAAAADPEAVAAATAAEDNVTEAHTSTAGLGDNDVREETGRRP